MYDIEVLYSDHDHQLIVVVDDVDAGSWCLSSGPQIGRGRAEANSGMNECRGRAQDLLADLRKPREPDRR